MFQNDFLEPLKIQNLKKYTEYYDFWKFSINSEINSCDESEWEGEGVK